jgi:hypothetical protein
MSIKQLPFGRLQNIGIICFMAIVAAQGSCSTSKQKGDAAAGNDGPTQDATAGAEAAGTEDAAFPGAVDGAGAVDGRDQTEAGDLRTASDAGGTSPTNTRPALDAAGDVRPDVSVLDADDQDTAIDAPRIPYRIDATGVDTIGGRYIRVSPIPGQPVVLDTKTQRVWQGCPGGVSGDTCATGTPIRPTRFEAQNYCRDLDWAGYQDWYLPESNQLIELTKTPQGWGIDTDAFPGSPQSLCAWSSSTAPGSALGYATCVYNNGNADDVSTTWNAGSYVRCVRQGP